MAEEKIILTLEADDRASKQIESVSKALRNLAKNANSGNGLSDMVSNFESGLDRFNSSMRKYNATMSGFNRTAMNIVKGAGAAIYDFTSDSIKNFQEFSEQHAKVLGAMAADYDKTAESQAKFFADSQKLKEQAMQIGTYGVNGTGALLDITGVSQAQESLVKAGIDINTIIDTNVLKDVITFAQGNDLDVDTAVSTAVTLGSQFNVDPKDWGLMLDKISHTADMSIVEVSDIVQSLKWASGIAAGLGRDGLTGTEKLNETLGMLTILGDFGLKGSQAGTGIQAMLTRILTGDTTVITDAQKEVAPGKALEKFYEFEKIAKPNGNLLPMAEVIDEMNTIMEDMTDEEQAWFSKKLFGLYQMKSAYALMNGEGADLNEIIKEIETQSEGTNENKLQQLLDSSYGQTTSLKNLWEGIKTDFGDRLNPFVSAVKTELFTFLKNDGNYDIDFSNLRDALDESCDLIEEKYGTAISNAVRGIGEVTIDLAEVTNEIGPVLGEGLVELITDAINGGGLFGEDGLFKNWSKMFANVDKEIDTSNLDQDSKDLATAIATCVDWFGKLAALNVATEIAELISSVLQILTIAGGAVINIAGACFVNTNGSTGTTPKTTTTPGGTTPGGTTTPRGSVKTSTGYKLKNGKSTIGIDADEVAEALGTDTDEVIKLMGDKSKYTVDDVAKAFGTSADDVINTVDDVAKSVAKTGSAWSKLSVIGKSLGVLFTGITIGSTAIEAYDKEKSGDGKGAAESVAGGAGNLAGGWAGFKAGTILGSYFGPWGAVIGGIGLGIIGSIFGEKAAESVTNAIIGDGTSADQMYYDQRVNDESALNKQQRSNLAVKPSQFGLPSSLDNYTDPMTGELNWDSIIGQLRLAEKFPTTHKSIFDKYNGIPSSKVAETLKDGQAYQNYLKALEEHKKSIDELDSKMSRISEGDSGYNASLDLGKRGYYNIWTGTKEEYVAWANGRTFIGANDGKTKKGTMSDPYFADEISNAVKQGTTDGFNSILPSFGTFIGDSVGSVISKDFIGPMPQSNNLITDANKIDNNISFQPNITISPPNVNVDVKVDKNDKVTKNTTITYPNTGGLLNQWHTRIQSQFGSTTK